MSLFTTYGVQSSVPAKTVVAVIDPASSGGNFYNITVTNYHRSTSNANTTYTGGDWWSTSKFQLTSNDLYYDKDLVAAIFVWNSNNTVIGYYARISGGGSQYQGTIDSWVPQSGQYVSFSALTGASIWGSPIISLSDFQAITFSTTPTSLSQTVTFFDEYPNGTQIGDVVNVTFALTDTAAGALTVSTGRRSFPNETLDSDQNWRSSQVFTLPTGATKVKFDSTSKYTVIRFDVGGEGYNPSTAPSNAGTMLANGLEAPVPAGATKFFMMAYTQNAFGYTAVSESIFASLVITIEAPGGSGIVNPPATYKIRQLVFEE